MTAATLARPTTRDWRHDAACAGMDTDRFFPLSTNTWEGVAQAMVALEVCHHCPVQAACLAWAMGLPKGERRSQVVGGRWFDSGGKPHLTPVLGGDDNPDSPEENR